VSGQFERVREILLAVLRVDPGERSAWLERSCPDPALRAEVESLLAQDVADAPAVRTGGALPGGAAGAEGLLARERIGTYEVLAVVAERDDAVLYRARSAAHPGRDIALRVWRADGAPPPHPAGGPGADSGIVLPFDAGTTAAGAVYLAREFVRGVPVTEYADQVHLSIRDRLELAASAARSLEAAHGGGLLHGNVCAANILVAREGGAAIPKIVDFGCRVADGDVRREDRRGFGAMLYELLTGSRPPRPGGVTANHVPLPSSAIDGPAAEERARRRRTATEAWRRALRGDVDRLVMRCLDGGGEAGDPTIGVARDLAALAARPEGGVPGRLRNLIRRATGLPPRRS
jgi:serine/threonine protein kinase